MAIEVKESILNLEDFYNKKPCKFILVQELAQYGN